MDKITHVIKRSELPQGVTLEKAAADFINSIPADLFSFDKIEMTGDEAIIEYHAILVKLMGEPASSFNQAVIECLKDDSQPSNLIDISVKLLPLPTDMQGRIAEYHQAMAECLKDPSVEGLMAYHGIVAGSDDEKYPAQIHIDLAQNPDVTTEARIGISPKGDVKFYGFDICKT